VSYLADPGGIFDSDAHRRTLAHLHTGETFTVEDLLERMRSDVGTDFGDEAELAEVLSDLEADGYATKTKDGWKQTKKGLGALNAPVPEGVET
jgi:hypothetical protein